jgi:hypothetical protein
MTRRAYARRVVGRQLSSPDAGARGAAYTKALIAVGARRQFAAASCGEVLSSARRRRGHLSARVDMRFGDLVREMTVWLVLLIVHGEWSRVLGFVIIGMPITVAIAGIIAMVGTGMLAGLAWLFDREATR